jgi:CRP-like cAMP-binding protein
VLDNLNSFMAFRKVSKSLRRRVRAAAKETMVKSLAFDESAIFGKGQLASPLVSEVTKYLMRDMIQILPFLDETNVLFLQGLASILQPVSYDMNEIFVQEGQVTDSCYYLMHGEILVTNRSGHKEEIQFLSDSPDENWIPIRFVGEAALNEHNLVNSPITVKCVANSRFYCLSGRELKALASRSALMTSQVQKFKLSHKLYHKAMLTEQGEDERLSLVEEFRANNAMKFWKKKLGSSSLVSQKMA